MIKISSAKETTGKGFIQALIQAAQLQKNICYSYQNMDILINPKIGVITIRRENKVETSIY